MASISDLGNGAGYIYVVNPANTSDIRFSIPNDSIGARSVKLLGLQSANIGANLRAFGSVTINSVTGIGNFTKLDVNGISQITAVVPYTGATSTSALAALIAAEVNSTVPASGVDYIGLAIDNKVYLLAPATTGDAVNGDVVQISFSANATGSVTDVDLGTEAYSEEYNSSFGYRFFIDTAENAASGRPSGTQVEITNFLCTRGFEGGIPLLTPTVSSGVITIERQAAIQYVRVDTEGGAGTDNLDSINPVNFADGDIIILFGTNASRVVTVTNSGNIVTQGAVSFSTGNYANAITLGKSGSSWYEINKSTTAVPSAADFRTASFPLLSTSGYGGANLTAADNTTVTLTANTDKQYQTVSGTVSLTTGNYEINLSTTGAKAGDIFIIKYVGAVTVGSFDVIIGSATLTAEDALTGGLTILAYYSGGAWLYTTFKSFYHSAKIQAADIASNAVTVAKLATELQYEVVTIPVSFETGEQCANKVKMPYAGTVSEIYGIVTKAIAATDAGTVTAKNNGGTTMTEGVITAAASAALDTAYTVTPTANNTFVAGDILSFTTAKTTVGGKMLLSIKITRS